jgi:hypothetical protein
VGSNYGRRRRIARLQVPAWAVRSLSRDATAGVEGGQIALFSSARAFFPLRLLSKCFAVFFRPVAISRYRLQFGRRRISSSGRRKRKPSCSFGFAHRSRVHSEADSGEPPLARSQGG